MKTIKVYLKQGIVLLLLVTYLIFNWLMDIFGHWVGYKYQCADNGFIRICDSTLYTHLLWYTSILYFIIITIWLLYELER